MTLFRKVLENQSTPATGDKGLDDDALRDAFLGSSEDRALSLDPFAVPKQRPEATPEDGAAGDAPGHDDAVDARLGAPFEEVEDDGSANIAAVLAQTRLIEDAPAAPTPASVDDVEIPHVLREDPAPGQIAPDQTRPDARPEQVAPRTKPEMDTEIADADTAIAPDTGPEHPEEKPARSDHAPADVVAFAKAQLSRSAEAAPDEDAMRTDPDASEPLADMPAPMTGRAGRRAGRVKTRLLGFNQGAAETADPVAAPEAAASAAHDDTFPAGWLVVVEGPGTGHAFSIVAGAWMIGRGEDQGIRLDFGDTSISRHNHAAIAYDAEDNRFYIGHGGKSNIIRRNARPVLCTEELHHADLLRIGETTLRFVALCGPDFQWDETDKDDARGV